MCQDGGQWNQVFSNYYAASIAMALGSFVAGSTPLGGGVVAFPVSVLVLGLTSEESRDASVLVQSIGMTAASFLLVVCKKQTLIPHIIYPSIVFGSIGVILGLSIDVSSYLVNLTFTVAVFLFMVIYMYTNMCVLPAAEEKRKMIYLVLRTKQTERTESFWETRTVFPPWSEVSSHQSRIG